VQDCDVRVEDFRIERVDPADEAAIEAFYDIYVTCGRHDAASFIMAPYAELAELVRRPTEDFAFTAFLAFAGDVLVGHGWHAAHLRANLDQVRSTPRVLPAHRRRGYGSAILRHLERVTLADGRHVLTTTPRWPTSYGPKGIGAPAVEFARKHGYELKLVEAKRRLTLPVAPERLAPAGTDPAYTIKAFSGPIPDDLVQGWAMLVASLPTEAPTGELEIEEVPPSVASIRDDERVLAATGQVKYNAVAIAPDGTLVGYTDIVVRADGEPAEQWGTLVRRAHRGRGLGVALKVAALALLQSERPDVTATITSNALDNAAMVAVNDRLGYEVLEYLGDVQRRLD
jgi:GNAT superfamily N-acetyltransferase